MQYIQSLCDAEDANIYFGTVIDPTMEGTVRVTVLATGFNPYSREGKQVAGATFAAPAPVPTVSPSSVELTSSRSAARRTPDAGGVFDESDLDIPAFIREHRQKS